MEKQLIITVSRESGSGGHEVCCLLGSRLGISVYDKNIFEGIGAQFDIDASRLEKYDEKPRMLGITRSVKNHTNSPEEQVVQMQREFIKSRADAGESFIILGRCGIKAVLDHPCVLIRLFIEADRDFKLKRTMEKMSCSEKEASRYMAWVDYQRRVHHDQFCTGVKWGERSTYDIVVKTSSMGTERTAQFLEHYVRMRMGEI